MRFETAATPEAAVDRLEALYEQAKTALRNDLHQFFATGTPPDASSAAGIAIRCCG